MPHLRVKAGRPGHPSTTLTEQLRADINSVSRSAVKTYGASLRKLAGDDRTYKALRNMRTRPVSARFAVRVVNAVLNSAPARRWRIEHLKGSWPTDDEPLCRWWRILERLLPDRLERQLAESPTWISGSAERMRNSTVRIVDLRVRPSDGRVFGLPDDPAKDDWCDRCEAAFVLPPKFSEPLELNPTREPLGEIVLPAGVLFGSLDP